MRGTAALGRLSGQLVVANNLKGRDGEFPKLWFFLKIVKRIIGIERFSEIWEKFRGRTISSLRGFGLRAITTRAIGGQPGRAKVAVF